jgi:hypothetical protein
MKVVDAAKQVLSQVGTPLHALEITKRILATDLWQTNGKTPHATVAARLYMDIKQRGDASPFVRTAQQTFALRGSSSVRADEEPRIARRMPGDTPPAAPPPGIIKAFGIYWRSDYIKWSTTPRIFGTVEPGA